jgi:hypothetical protein
MKVFALDILHDLRSKRLWPVAVVLLVAIIAVPAVLLSAGSGDEEIAPPPGPSPPAAGSDLPTNVKVSDEPLGGSSKLDEFSAHNPFRPKLPEPKVEESQAKAAAEFVEQVTSGSGTATTPTDSSSNAPADTGKAGSDTSTGGGGKSQQDASTGTPAKDVKPQTKTELLSYEIDAAYGPAGAVNRHENIRALDLIPAKRRLLMFSGVARDQHRALFTVLDSGLQAEKGDGHCVRVADRCSVLHLKAGDERRFRDAKGNKFVIRLAAIRSVKLDPKQTTGELARTVEQLVDQPK